jgi:hypothetical protein
MALTEIEGPPGPPWERPPGNLDRVVVESELLAGNPLGDPPQRARSMSTGRPGSNSTTRVRFPSVYVIQGYTGR